MHYDGSTWTPMDPAPGINFITGLWGTSSSDLFAVTSSGMLAHYDGSTWTIVEVGQSSNSPDTIRGIFGLSSNDVYAYGVNGLFYHWDGTTWTDMSYPSTRWHIQGAWGSSPSDIYGVVQRGEISHFDGTSWAVVATAQFGSFRNIWGTSATDVYAFGDDVIMHYDGSTWSVVSGGNPHFNAMWGFSGKDIFAVGDRGVVAHYDGSDWKLMQQDNYVSSLNDVWGSSPTDVYAVGNPDGILHYDGIAWSRVDLKIVAPASDYFGVWGSSANDVFVTGQNMLLHYDGTAWTNMGTHGSLYWTVWGNSPSDVYVGIAGMAGLIVHCNGAGCSEYGVTGFMPTDIWGSPGGGTYFTGISFFTAQRDRVMKSGPQGLTEVQTGIVGDVLGIWGNAADDVFVGGENGKVSHYNGSDWELMDTGFAGRVVPKWGTPTELFAFSHHGILRYNRLVNEAPTDIALSAHRVTESSAPGTTVGRLSTTDPNAGDMFTYTLVAGQGCEDNESFKIQDGGKRLSTTAVFDDETKSTYSVRVRSTDQGGLWYEKVFAITVPHPDRTAPVGAIAINGGAAFTKVRRVTLDLTASDGGGSGLKAMRIANAGRSAGAWMPFRATKSWRLSRRSGTKTVYVKFKDKAGNISDADPVKARLQSYQSTIIYDAIRPKGSMLINNGAAATDSATVTLNLSARDAGGSGLDAMRFMNAGGTATDWEPYKTTKTWILPSGSGTKTVYAQFRDKAGNISDANRVKVGAQFSSGKIQYAGL